MLCDCVCVAVVLEAKIVQTSMLAVHARFNTGPWMYVCADTSVGVCDIERWERCRLRLTRCLLIVSLPISNYH